MFNPSYPTGEDWKKAIEESKSLVYNEYDQEVAKSTFFGLIEEGKFLEPLGDSVVDEDGYHISKHEDFC